MDAMIKGMLYVFTGDGKGKTSAALGVTLRMLLLDKKVVWISWYKSNSWDISEKKMANLFSKNLTMYWIGKGFYIKNAKSAKVNKAVVFDFDTPSGHKKAAKEGLKLVGEILREQDKNGVELVVMDEINQTITDGLLTVNELNAVISMRGGVNMIMTGRKFPGKLKGEVDLITDMRKIKHPYDEGKMAIKGLDF